MARQYYEFTSESVSEGHPDKVCDRISDEVVDLFFREGAKAGIDPYQIRVACETLATTNRVIIAGEVRGPSLSNEQIEATARRPTASRDSQGAAHGPLQALHILQRAGNERPDCRVVVGLLFRTLQIHADGGETVAHLVRQ